MLGAWMILAAGLALSAIAQEQTNTGGKTSPPDASSASVSSTETHASSLPAAQPSEKEARALRAEGEKRFRTNCGRCHMAPHRFPPKVMATAIRHMRVRAMITDEDMRLILRYMTE